MGTLCPTIAMLEKHGLRSAKAVSIKAVVRARRDLHRSDYHDLVATNAAAAYVSHRPTIVRKPRFRMSAVRMDINTWYGRNWGGSRPAAFAACPTYWR